MMIFNKVKKIKKDLIETGKLMGVKNYTPGYSGNLSAKIDEENILITISGSANGYLTEDDFTIIDFDGNSLIKNKKPSSEKKLHIEFYKQRKDINFIIHSHPVYLSAFASSGKDLLKPVMAENVFYFKGIPLAKYGLPSSDALVENTAEFFADYDAILMANHGIVIGSHSLKDAYYKLELAEQYAQVVLNTYVLGGAIELTPEQEQEILKLR